MCITLDLIHRFSTYKSKNHSINTLENKSYPQNVDKMLITFLSHVKIKKASSHKALFFRHLPVCEWFVQFIHIGVDLF